MEKSKGFLFIFILSVLFIVTISSSWAGKPPSSPSIAYGYAKLDDSQGMAVKSDYKGQYIDCSKAGGEDFVEINYFTNDGSYQKIDVVLGRMKNYHPEYPVSLRRLNLCFNVLGGTKTNYVGNEAIYDILEKYKIGDNPFYRSSDLINKPGYIDGNSVHAQIFTSVVGSPVINFMVDPTSTCDSDLAISDKKINEFYDWDDPNLNYTDTYEYGEGGQTFYRLTYTAGFNVVTSSDKRTWTITPKDGTVELSVKKYKSLSSNGAARTIVLATYDAVPFRLTVWLDPTTGAPRKQDTVSTTWGDIKR